MTTLSLPAHALIHIAALGTDVFDEVDDAVDTAGVVRRRRALGELQLGLVERLIRTDYTRVNRQLVQHRRRLEHLPRGFVSGIARYAQFLPRLVSPLDRIEQERIARSPIGVDFGDLSNSGE